MGIVAHHSRKQLGLFPKPLLQQQELKTENNSDASSDHFHREPPDYGTSTSPPPTLHHIPTPEWSVSSLDSGRATGAAGRVTGSVSADNGSVSSAGKGGSQKRYLSGSSFGSQERIKEETNL